MAALERGQPLTVYLGDAVGKRQLRAVVQLVREQGLNEGLDPDGVVLLAEKHERGVRCV